MTETLKALLDETQGNENHCAMGLVDGYFVELDHESPETLVEHSAYWYSMWSHTRNMAWKGYLQIDLSPAGDSNVQERLNLLERQLVQP